MNGAMNGAMKGASRISGWSAAEVANAVSGEWHIGQPEQIDLVQTDTRKLTPGTLFVALRGERFDGHDFVANAAEAGAVAALVTEVDESVDLPQLLVEDTLEALQTLGNRIWSQATSEGLESVALTGSNGKTTTKEFLAALFRTVGQTHQTPGNFNNHIGVPLTLCALPAAANFAVIEMGANDFGDIRELIAMAPARYRVLVSIGAAHLENLGDLDGVRRVKSEIFEHSEPEDVAIVPTLHRPGLHTDRFAGTMILVGDGGAFAFDVDPDTREVVVDWDGGSCRLTSPYPGEHNAANLALAVATFVAAGYSPNAEAIERELERLVLPGGRLRRVSVGELTFVDDAYNANPTSVLASYDAFLEIAGRELGVAPEDRIAMLGEMFELGADAELMHAQTAEAMAIRGGAGTFVWVGPFAESMAGAASKHSGQHHVAPTVEEAARLLPASGLVFLKASRGQRLERVIDLVEGT